MATAGAHYFSTHGCAMFGPLGKEGTRCLGFRLRCTQRGASTDNACWGEHSGFPLCTTSHYFMDPPAGSKRAERPESLGWLTESGVMPKKQREIEGVGASSLVDLQAQLFRAQVPHHPLAHPISRRTTMRSTTQSTEVVVRCSYWSTDAMRCAFCGGASRAANPS